MDVVNERLANIVNTSISASTLTDTNICFQFERIGYFKFDGYDELTNLPVFIQIVGLFDNKKI